MESVVVSRYMIGIRGARSLIYDEASLLEYITCPSSLEKQIIIPDMHIENSRDN